MIEYFSHNLWLAWLVLSLVLMIVEMTSFDFFVTCFAIGALGGMCGALIGLPLWVQVLVWAVVSMLSIFFIRPVLTAHIHKGGKDRRSNADALLDKRGVVIDPIPVGGHGYVKIDGDEWRSVSASGAEITTGTTVRVVSRDSIILTVEPV